jgi:hypothetical protein
VILALVAGCGGAAGSRYPVQGSVSYDGQTVDAGGIAFLPEGDTEGEKRATATGQIKDGHYALDGRNGPNAGKYRVQLWWKKKAGKQVRGEGGVMKDETEEGLPAKYNSASEQVVEVKSGGNTMDFNLEK